MAEFVRYRRTAVAEMRPYEPGEPMDLVSMADVDVAAGSPRVGDMIARNPRNHKDQWLVAAQYFDENFEDIV